MFCYAVEPTIALNKKKKKSAHYILVKAWKKVGNAVKNYRQKHTSFQTVSKEVCELKCNKIKDLSSRQLKM